MTTCGVKRAVATCSIGEDCNRECQIANRIPTQKACKKLGMSGWHNFRELYDNRIILRRLRRNDAGDKKTLWIQKNRHEKKDKECIDYCPEGGV